MSNADTLGRETALSYLFYLFLAEIPASLKAKRGHLFLKADW